MDPTRSALNVLRPQGEDVDSWIRKWQPDKRTGTLIAASGYLNLDDKVASAPSDADKPDPGDLTALLFTDSGLLRADATVKLISLAKVQIGLAIDFNAGTISAGVQGPQLTLPQPPAEPKMTISAGYVGFTIGFRDLNKFGISIGWPERVGGTEFDRDWGQSVKVYIPDMKPINTFWGGIRSFYDGSQGTKIQMGWAIRAGWTWEQDKGISGIAKAHADLGIAFGGVFQFEFDSDSSHGGNPAIARAAMAPRAALANALSPTSSVTWVAVSNALELLDAAMLAEADVKMEAELFGDVWGDATVEFMGVSLVGIHIRAFARFDVCGSFHTGIMSAKGTVGFDVEITIACVHYHTHASIDITLIDRGPCQIQLEDGSLVLPSQLRDFLPVEAGL
jgi:hypothetical protein